MLPAIATVSVPGTLTDKLQAIAAAGFRGIEIFEQDFIALAHGGAHAFRAADHRHIHRAGNNYHVGG